MSKSIVESALAGADQNELSRNARLARRLQEKAARQVAAGGNPREFREFDDNGEENLNDDERADEKDELADRAFTDSTNDDGLKAISFVAARTCACAC